MRSVLVAEYHELRTTPTTQLRLPRLQDPIYRRKLFGSNVSSDSSVKDIDTPHLKFVWGLGRLFDGNLIRIDPVCTQTQFIVLGP